MLNLLPPNLQNLLNNQRNKINLISEEFKKIEITEEQSNSFDNIFLISSIIFSILILFLTYFNYQKNIEVFLKYNNLANNLLTVQNTDYTQEDLEQRIQVLSKYNEVNSKKIKVAEFYFFLALIRSYLSEDQLVKINFNQNEKRFDYEIIVNINRNLLEQDINSYLQNNLISNKVTKSGEINLNQNNLRQFVFKGTYELK